MKKYYLICLYFLFFIPLSFFYKILRKPIYEKYISFDSKQDKASDEKVVLLQNESQKYKKTLFISLLEKIMPKYN